MEITVNLLLTYLVLAWASYRATRFVVIDTLIENVRGRVQTFLFNREGKTKVVWHKLLDLISCTWCAGFWVSLTVYSLWFWTNPIDFTRFDVIIILAIAGVQGILHALEPGDA